MKIIHIINKFTHTSIPVEMAELMAQKNNEVAILSFYDKQSKAEEFKNITCKNCKVYGIDFKKNKIKALKNLFKILNKYEIVHTHHALSGALARIIAHKKSKIKIVHTIHANHHSFNVIQNIIIGLTLNLSDVIVCNSESTKEGILKWQKMLIKKCKLEVIYNGIDTSRILNSSKDGLKKIVDLYSIDSKKYVYTQLGRLEPVKNPCSSLYAYEKLINERKDIYNQSLFIFIGDGSLKNDINSYLDKKPNLKNNVILTGNLKRNDVYSFLSRVDTLVVPSFYEGFCNALFEAMTIGMNVAISNIDVFNELICISNNIFKMNPNSVDSIKDALEKSYDNKISKKLVDLMRNETIKKFDKNICINNYINLYHNM